MTENKAIPELGVEARLLIGIFQKMEVGQFVPYSELSAAIGRDVQRKGYGSQDTARRHVEREYGIVLAPVMGSGLKRLDDIAIIEVGAKCINKARKAGKRAYSTTMRVRDYAALSPEQRAELGRIQSISGVIQMFTTKDAAKKVAAIVHTQGKMIAPQKMLDAFRAKAE